MYRPSYSASSFKPPVPVKPLELVDFYGAGTRWYAIYPDYWKREWGPTPLLGHVWADNKFYAVRKAYTEGLLTVNFTFGAKAIETPYSSSAANYTSQASINKSN